MSLILAIAVVAAFSGAIARLGLVERAREATSRARECLDVMRNPALDDDQKQRMLQRQSLHLFGLAAILTGGAALAMAVPLLAVWMLDRAGLASFHGVLSILQRADFLVATFAVGLVVFIAYRVRRL